METYSEENYLKVIYNLSVSCKNSVLTNTVAESMKTKPSSATDMFKRLSKKKLIKYKKYKGVLLTSLGRKKALNVIRKHRLWELFLLEHLEFSWDEVHDVAEQLEHVNSTLLIKKLDEFLHFPDKDPHGAPIPDENGNISKIKSKTLDLIDSGNHCTVVGVQESSSEFLKYLQEMNILLNTKIKVKDKYAYDGSMVIETGNKKEITVSSKVTQNLYVK